MKLNKKKYFFQAKTNKTRHPVTRTGAAKGVKSSKSIMSKAKRPKQ
jgi:hypothetical protein